MRKSIKLFLILLLCVLCAAVGFFLGRRTAPATGTTFYATIARLDDDYMLVEGLDVNGINYRGAFDFVVDDGTRLTWNLTEITMEDFQIGDRVAVTFTGGIQETSPAGLVKVLCVDLLEQVQAPAPDNAEPTLSVSRAERNDPISLSYEDTAALLELLETAEWMNDSTKCESDCVLEYNDQVIYYHSDCGSFNAQNHCLVLTGPQKTKVNDLLSAYISLGFEVS